MTDDHIKLKFESSSVARGGGRGGLEPPPIGLWSMQNRTFLVALRPIFCEKLKIAPPPQENSPPQTFEFPIWAEKSVSKSVKTFFSFFFGDHPILGGKNVWISDFGRKISPKIGEDLFFFFFLETTWFWAETTFEFSSFPRNSVSIFGQTVWNWFKNNESWLRACLRGILLE